MFHPCLVGVKCRVFDSESFTRVEWGSDVSVTPGFG